MADHTTRRQPTHQVTGTVHHSGYGLHIIELDRHHTAGVPTAFTIEKTNDQVTNQLIIWTIKNRPDAAHQRQIPTRLRTIVAGTGIVATQQQLVVHGTGTIYATSPTDPAPKMITSNEWVEHHRFEHPRTDTGDVATLSDTRHRPGTANEALIVETTPTTTSSAEPTPNPHRCVELLGRLRLGAWQVFCNDPGTAELRHSYHHELLLRRIAGLQALLVQETRTRDHHDTARTELDDTIRNHQAQLDQALAQLT